MWKPNKLLRLNLLLCYTDTLDFSGIFKFKEFCLSCACNWFRLLNKTHDISVLLFTKSFLTVFISSTLIMSVTVIRKCRMCDTFSCDNSPVYFCKTCRLDLCERCISAHLRFFSLHDVVRHRDKHTTNTAIPLCSIHSLRCEFFCKDCKASVCWKTSHLHKFHRTIDFIEELNCLHALTALLFYKIMPVYSRMFSRLRWNFWQNATLFETVRKH